MLINFLFIHAPPSHPAPPRLTLLGGEKSIIKCDILFTKESSLGAFVKVPLAFGHQTADPIPDSVLYISPRSTKMPIYLLVIIGITFTSKAMPKMHFNFLHCLSKQHLFELYHIILLTLAFLCHKSNSESAKVFAGKHKFSNQNSKGINNEKDELRQQKALKHLVPERIT
ncbi:hypothetical protein ACTXT7_008866 [Hymenolepis weldensis]